MNVGLFLFYFFFFKQKTAYEMRISDWSSDVCSSDLSSFVTRRLKAGGRTGDDAACAIAGHGAGSDRDRGDDRARHVAVAPCRMEGNADRARRRKSAGGDGRSPRHPAAGAGLSPLSRELRTDRISSAQGRHGTRRYVGLAAAGGLRPKAG